MEKEGFVITCKLCSAVIGSTNKAADSQGVCWECLIEQWEPLPETKKKHLGFPRGWKFLKVFVHSNGDVYHKGIEQPDLKGTLPATPIEPKPSKKTKREKQQEQQQLFVELGNLKKQLKKETRKTAIKKLQSKIKKVQKQLQ